VKQPRPKLHFAFSAEPLQSGSDTEAVCGEIVFHAQHAFAWDTIAVGQEMMLPTLTGRVCRDCLAKVQSAPVEEILQYLYGLLEVNAEEKAGATVGVEG